MRQFTIARRPGLRALVLGLCGGLVIGTAVLVSLNVSGHLERAAVNEADAGRFHDRELGRSVA